MITVTMDKREDPYVMKDKYQLFALSKQMVTSLVKIAGEENGAGRRAGLSVPGAGLAF